MCGGEKYFSAILYSTYLPRELQWYWTYLDLSVVPTQLVQKGVSISQLLCSWCKQESIVEKVLSQWARDSIALFWRSSVGIIPARTKRLLIGVGRRHPITNRKTGLLAVAPDKGTILSSRVDQSKAGRMQCFKRIFVVKRQNGIRGFVGFKF